MNKQEAIERIKNIGTLNIYDKVAGQQVDMVIKNEVLDIISQIHEPQKVTIPEFVAEWLKESTHADTLVQVLNAVENEQVVPSTVNDWILDNQRDFVIAWIDGYNVEKEPLYTVEIPNNGGTLVLGCINQAIKLVDGNKHFPGKFTKGSIGNAGFDWAWQFAKKVK
ncbi:TPA: DUF1642 domain-containing protein [Streptococcus suis]